jgi:hypothetical protein
MRLCCVIGFPEAIEQLRQMTWKIGAVDRKICLQLALENPSHFLVSQIDHYGSPRISVRRQVPSPQSSAHFYRVDAQLLKDDFKPRPPIGVEQRPLVSF